MTAEELKVAIRAALETNDAFTSNHIPDEIKAIDLVIDQAAAGGLVPAPTLAQVLASGADAEGSTMGNIQAIELLQQLNISQPDGKIFIKSPNGTAFVVSVSDAGEIVVNSD